MARLIRAGHHSGQQPTRLEMPELVKLLLNGAQRLERARQHNRIGVLENRLSDTDFDHSEENSLLGLRRLGQLEDPIPYQAFDYLVKGPDRLLAQFGNLQQRTSAV